jgi:O-Antigen ligase
VDTVAPVVTSSALGRGLRDPVAVPGALSFAVFVIYAVKDGGYQPTVWYPGALVLLVLAALVWNWHIGRDEPLPRPLRAAVAALAALSAWSFVSIAWADVKGDAWDGANRTLLYLLVFSLFALLPWTAETASVLLGAFGLVVAGLGTFELSRAAASSHPDSYFQLGRFAQPTNYQNSACALYMLAFWPALLVATRREFPIPVRALGTSACALLVELALLCQSRAWIIALPVTLVVYLVAVGRPARTLVFLVPAAIALAVAAPTLTAVFAAIRDRNDIAGAVASARNAVLVSLVACFVTGFVLSVLDRRVEHAGLRLAARRTVIGAWLLCLLAGVALAAGKLEHPIARVEHEWRSFKNVQPGSRRSYFSTGLGGTRYDIWRVAIREVERAPLIGVGVDNFAVDYLRERRSQEEPQYPHSLELRLLAQTGVVGAALFAVFLAAVALALARLSALPELGRASAGCIVALFAYWLVHGSVDWFWEMPVLGGVAFSSLGIAVGLARPRRAEGAPANRGARLPVALVVAALAAPVALSFALPWLAAAEVDSAASTWRTQPNEAFRRLSLARRLNPLSDEPDLVAGAIASRLGEHRRMRVAFDRALGRNSQNWYANFELALLDATAGRRSAALRRLSAARRLNPREPEITFLGQEIHQGRHISPSSLDEVFLARIRA